MKCFVRVFVLFSVLALLLCGCVDSKHSSETTIPADTVTESLMVDPFASVDEIYRGVLESCTAVGYALLDMDGNGTDELLLTDGEQIYELLAICDDGVLHKKLERTQYITDIRLCSDNRVFVHETDDHGCDYYYVLSMRTAVGNLPQELFVLTDGDRWWAGPYEKNAELTTQAEAEALLDAIAFIQIEYIPLN